ncbi:cytochrome c/c1 heme-lyase [Chytriomyces sp. MP71]|nr:cytochrome c/c1 heme-lyase [Chytriomyces sp. MP71]
MPATPNLAQAWGQLERLSTEREVSSIPMAGKHEGKTWVCPSEQMYFNRKSWDAKEGDMVIVVPIHNVVNEECWSKILEWEGFTGTPREYTPKARILNLLGYKLPFDRHDWIVDRCGKEVRYVIDFYGGNTGGVSFFLDVRPAVSYDGILDRCRRFWRTGTGLF